MKTLRQFLREDTEFKPFHIDRYENGFHHLKYFGNDNVEVKAARDVGIANSYTMSYSVNGSLNKDDNPHMPEHQKVHIGLHAAKMMGHFIRQHKPYSIEFEAHNKEHREIFHKTAGEIASRLGYNHNVDHGDPRSDQPDIHILTKKRTL